MNTFNGVIYYKKRGNNMFMLSRSASTIQLLFRFDSELLSDLYDRWPSAKGNLYIFYAGKEFKLEPEL